MTTNPSSSAVCSVCGSKLEVAIVDNVERLNYCPKCRDLRNAVPCNLQSSEQKPEQEDILVCYRDCDKWEKGVKKPPASVTEGEIHFTDGELSIFADLISNIQDGSPLKSTGARMLRAVAKFRFLQAQNKELVAESKMMVEALKEVSETSMQEGKNETADPPYYLNRFMNIGAIARNALSSLSRE